MFVVLVILFLSWARIKFVIEVWDSHIVFSEFRFFGLKQWKSTSIPRSELGTIVLDTRYSTACSCAYGPLAGFRGVYATRAIPLLGQKPEVIFEIPFVYGAWLCLLSPYFETYYAIQRALGFMHQAT